jgi:phosphoenolpyruvate carboxykinase (GTP)
VIKWVIERVMGTGKAEKTPIGYMPASGAIDTDGLAISPEAMRGLLEIDREKWLREVESIRAYYSELDRLPEEMKAQLAALEKRLEE